MILRERTEAIEARRACLDDHSAWLDRYRDCILAAGSPSRAEPDNPIGRLWIVEAESTDQVERLIESDPFTTAGLKAGHEVLHRRLAFSGRRVSF